VGLDVDTIVSEILRTLPAEVADRADQSSRRAV
jgi:1-deoxy-D-xylulose-5-phosphate synthase